MNRRWLCSDVWMDILPSFDLAQLGLKMALLSPRFDVLVDAHFDGKSELTIWRSIVIRKDKAGPRPKLSKWTNGCKFADFPLPDRPLPNKICFKNLQIEYIDHSVIEFLRSNKQIWNRTGTKLDLDLYSSLTDDIHPIWDVLASEIWPLFLTKIRHFCFRNAIHLDNLRRLISPTFLTDSIQLNSIDSGALFPDGIADDGPNATAGEALAKWVHTPSKNGQPNELRCNDFLSPPNLEWVNDFKETFRRATTSVSYQIQLYFLVEPTPNEQFELVNERTKEKLTLIVTLKHSKEYNGSVYNWLLQRCPIGETATAPIKWENRENSGANLNYISFDLRHANYLCANLNKIRFELWRGNHRIGYYCNLLLPVRPMPPKKTKAAWLRDWITRIEGNDIYTTDGRVVFCEACQQQAPSDQFYQLHQHNQTAKHLKNAQRLKEKQNRQKQQFLPTTSTNIPDKFTFDLCSAMISANIPFNKIENNNFRGFLEKNCGRNVPTGKTLHNYLERCFYQKMSEIKQELDGCFYWCSVDETTDKAGRFIANLLLGILDGRKWHAPKLVSVKALDKVNSGSIARFVFYPNLLSVTCLAHGLHRIAEKIRDQFPNVDRLIAKTKAVFVKAPYRIKTFRDKMPDLPLPPKPVLTRWGTWMCAAAYYWKYFQSIKAVVDTFDPNDAACIEDCQECFTDSVWQDLAYIESNFGRLSQAITKLETQGLTIQEALEIFAGVQNEMDNANGEKAERIREKFAFIVSNNAGLQTISQFCQILSGKNTQCDVPPNLVPFYKFAPLTSVDVERSFSIYKWLCSDVWMDILPSFDHVQLGLKMALVSDRFDVLVDAHFDGKSELTIWSHIRIRKDIGPKAKLYANGTFVEFPLPDRPLPNKIRFHFLQIDYIDHSVLTFLRSNKQIWDRNGTKLQLSIDDENTEDSQPIWDVFAREIWPIFEKSIRHLGFNNGDQLDNFRRRTSPTILTDLDQLNTINSGFLLPDGIADFDVLNPTAGQVLAKWLHTPSKNGQPKQLHRNGVLCLANLEWVNSFKETFLNATTSVSYKIQLYFYATTMPIEQFELMNERTKEKLTLKVSIEYNDSVYNWLLRRCPIGETATVPEVKWRDSVNLSANLNNITFDLWRFDRSIGQLSPPAKEEKEEDEAD
ncbi:hypothetical protein niasHT_038227 [Heterodera trifolii]|uniref:DUF659 domain-containing protein n=1 Tax=Heterodera trifolii TaxID=157864 RepID=A0ABD2IYN3_9BILA